MYVIVIDFSYVVYRDLVIVFVFCCLEREENITTPINMTKNKQLCSTHQQRLNLWRLTQSCNIDKLGFPQIGNKISFIWQSSGARRLPSSIVVAAPPRLTPHCLITCHFATKVLPGIGKCGWEAEGCTWLFIFHPTFKYWYVHLSIFFFYLHVL